LTFTLFATFTRLTTVFAATRTTTALLRAVLPFGAILALGAFGTIVIGCG
jgi:hypothetical protein